MSVSLARVLYLSLLILALASVTAPAQVNLSTLSYSQDFDSLGSVSATWTDNTTLLGWYAMVNASGSVAPYTTAYTVGSGGGTSSSTLYALGISGTSERALGGAPSSVNQGLLGLRMLNTSGSTYYDIRISYAMEQWSDRGTAEVALSYQVFPAGAGGLGELAGWTTLLTTPSPLPTSATPATGLGNTLGLVPGLVGGVGGTLSWDDGEELWLRWTITKIDGANATHGLDNVLITVPEPSAILLGGSALALLLTYRRLRFRG